MRMIFAILIFMLAGGCATNAVGKSLPWNAAMKKLGEPKQATPVKIVAIWTPTVLAQPGQPASRGLGGRLYFFDDHDQAIPVEGQFAVFAYDDTHVAQAGQSSTPGAVEPNRKFVFTAEQFARHYSPTDLGPSYSVWIPWDGMEGPQTELSLVPVFTTIGGQIVMGQSSRHVLKGAKQASPAASANPAFQQNTDTLAVPPASIAEKPINVASFPLTPSLKENLRRADSAPSATTRPGVLGGGDKLGATGSANSESSFNAQPPASPIASFTALEKLKLQPWSPPDPRSNRFERPRSQALIAPRPPPAAFPVPWAPGPLGSPSSPASLPQSPPFSPAPANGPSAFPTAG